MPTNENPKTYDGEFAKKQVKAAYERLIKKFARWAQNQSDIRGAIVVGSRAREKYPADEWADLDVIVITTQPEQYIACADWIKNMGDPILTFVEPTADGEEKERRVLYEGMLDVDFAVFPMERVQALIRNAKDPQVAAALANSLGRGVRVLLDKDGTLAKIEPLVGSIEIPKRCPPTEQEFLAVVNDFLYHAVFTVKHVKRGELWWAKSCSDCYMQQLMLQMMEWHARTLQGQDYDTWFRGRFLEEWVEPEVLKDLRKTFSHYDEKDIGRALVASFNLFRKMAYEISAKLGYSYPDKAGEIVTSWILNCLDSER